MNQNQIRNFAIIAHVDAGKSTLSDRLMEFTGTVAKSDLREQMLDSNPIERERGVTIKLAPVTMRYGRQQIPNAKLQIPNTDDTDYILNLIDTPGHVDFSYEVERSLAAGEGAILLIDGTRGIQAQTLSHARKATDLGLTIIPAVNKVDLAASDYQNCAIQLNEVFGFDEERILPISAKTGAGVDKLLERIIEEIPAPSGKAEGMVRALVFNSIYDEYLGAVAFIKVVDGSIKNGEQLLMWQSGLVISPKEIGIFTPKRKAVEKLETGQVGYIATGLKDIRKIKPGDTVTKMTFLPRRPAGVLASAAPIAQVAGGRRGSPSRATPASLQPLPGYREPKPVVFADAYPTEGATYQKLLEAIEKLKLSDASLVTESVNSPALGPGARLGFLGLFHIEITKERILREYGVETVLTAPTVAYRAKLTNGKEIEIKTAGQLPDPSHIKEIQEPIVNLTLITPAEFAGGLMQTLEDQRGEYQNTIYAGSNTQLIYKLPLSELISGLVDKIKSASKGFAAVDYEISGYKPVKAVKLTILLNHEEVEALARIVAAERAERIGRQMVEKLKDLLPQQLFTVPIQAAAGGNIIARETKAAFRKDVTAKLYGGDQTRKDKLLKKQKKGKKKMALIGKVRVPSEVFTKMMEG